MISIFFGESSGFLGGAKAKTYLFWLLFKPLASFQTDFLEVLLSEYFYLLNKFRK
jgi:hypothetical protein